MSELVDVFGDDLWRIVEDLAAFFYPKCATCMPWDEGPVWLSPPKDALDVLEEVTSEVAGVHGIDLDIIDYGMLVKALDESDISCPSCGDEWNTGSNVSKDWNPSEVKTAQATHLLTKRYWPYLTHYTRGLDSLQSIIETSVVTASSNLIASGDRVVCFTECSPLEVLELSKARDDDWYGTQDERYAWNRSHHGIALRRGAACDAGVLPAIHGSRALMGAHTSSR